jgi:hypothetical protein
MTFVEALLSEDDEDLLDALEDLEAFEQVEDDETDDVFEDEPVFEDDDLFDDELEGWDEDDESDWVEWDDPFPAVRSVLAPELQDLAPHEIESLLASMGLDAEDMEFNLGKAFSSIGKAAAGLAPSILPVAGGVLGTVVGGPLGGMVGSQLGNLAGGAVAGAVSRPGPRRTPRPAARRPAVGAPRPPAVAGAPAQALLSVLNRPELRQAVSALALGPSGATQIPVGGTAVPPAAFANLLTSLGSRILGEQAGDGDGAIPEYLLDDVGNLAVDPTVPEQRSERLLELLEAAAAQEAAWIESLAVDAWQRGAWTEADDD